MIRLFIHILFVLALTLPLPVVAQEEDDKTFLENKLQEILSGVGREVSITGFEGALSSNARLARMTISDADGIWLTLIDAQLVWTRRALLAGRLEISELSAEKIEITRLPISEPSLDVSDSEASPFALPELPVSLNIDTLNIAEITLSENVLGEEASLTVSGRLSLADGDGDANLDILRTDRQDALKLDGMFSNESRILGLNIDFVEDQGGLVGKLIGIPGEPALGLQITGEAPFSDYTAQIALSSDNQPRFGGQVGIRQDGNTDSAYSVQAELGGDVRPLFTPDLHPFFGETSRLSLDALLRPDGGTDLNSFELSSGALQLAGSLYLAADGWPDRFDLSGEIRADERVRLPIGGPATTIESLILAARYNKQSGDSWFANITLDGFEQDGIKFKEAALLGEGVIRRIPQPALSGSLSFGIDEFQTSDPGINDALGKQLIGSTLFDWEPDTPLSVTSLSLRSEGLELEMDAELDQLADGLPVSGRARLVTDNIARFSKLLEREVSGSAEATIAGRATVLSGAFEASLEAETNGLQLDVPNLDPLLAKQTSLSMTAARDETGTQLRAFRLSNDDARIIASGRLNSDNGLLNASAALNDIALVEPRLVGEAKLELEIDWVQAEPIRLKYLDALIGGAQITASGLLEPDDAALPVSGDLKIEADDLARFAEISGLPLSGKLSADLRGAAELQGDTFNLEFQIDGADVRSGIVQLDKLIAGDVSATAAIASSDTAPDLRYLKISSTNLQANATGSGPGQPIAVSTRLSDLGLITDAISGPLAARGNLTIKDKLAENITINVDATGAGGIVASLAGSILGYGQSLDLAATGSAPLQLINRFITPQSVRGDVAFNLAIKGLPQLASVSGDVSFSDARAALPRLGYALDGLTGSISLADSTATLSISGSAGTGGRFEVTGPITASAPYRADLDVRLSKLGLSDFELYSTKIDGAVNVEGPLLGGALLSGDIVLNETELRVPSGSVGALGSLPDLTHIAEPPATVLTRRRAGMIKEEKAPPASFPIDLTISSRNQIFVRGRGLDAELGGEIRLQGTTTNVRASGSFELIRGRLDLLGKRLDLVEGLIDMRGSLDPYLRFVAETEAEEVLVRVIVDGLASEPNVTFTSDPDLPQEEVVARLLFGRALDKISPFQAAQLVAAVATLTGRSNGGVVGNLREALGLSDLDVSTTDEGATQVRAGAYLSDNIYTEVIADSEGKEEINLNLDVSRSVTIRGTANDEGNTGIGVFFEKDY